jgi:hypothetical protein
MVHAGGCGIGLPKAAPRPLGFRTLMGEGSGRIWFRWAHPGVIGMRPTTKKATAEVFATPRTAVDRLARLAWIGHRAAQDQPRGRTIQANRRAA